MTTLNINIYRQISKDCRIRGQDIEPKWLKNSDFQRTLETIQEKFFIILKYEMNGQMHTSNSGLAQ